MVEPAGKTGQQRRGRAAFEVLNVSGKIARGMEIDLTGFSAGEVFHAYYLNRYGSPAVIRTPDLIRIRFASLWRATATTLSQTSMVRTGTGAAGSRPFTWELALYGGGGSERLCLEMSTCDVIATYRWLVAAGVSGDALVAEGTPAFVLDARTGTPRAGTALSSPWLPAAADRIPS